MITSSPAGDCEGDTITQQLLEFSSNQQPRLTWTVVSAPAVGQVSIRLCTSEGNCLEDALISSHNSTSNMADITLPQTSAARYTLSPFTIKLTSLVDSSVTASTPGFNIVGRLDVSIPAVPVNIAGGTSVRVDWVPYNLPSDVDVKVSLVSTNGNVGKVVATNTPLKDGGYTITSFDSGVDVSVVDSPYKLCVATLDAKVSQCSREFDVTATIKDVTYKKVSGPEVRASDTRVYGETVLEVEWTTLNLSPLLVQSGNYPLHSPLLVTICPSHKDLQFQHILSSPVHSNEYRLQWRMGSPRN